MTMRMYANRKQLPLESIEILLEHDRIHAEDCEQCESTEGFVDKITKIIKLEGPINEEQREKLLQIADKCPVHKTLHNEILIETVSIQ